ncbi:MAG: ABC transporter permease [Bacteroidota bacterium]
MGNHNKVNPPKWPQRLLGWYCDPLAAEDLLGDVDEIFYYNLEHMSARKARWKYVWQVFSLLFSKAVRKRRKEHREKYGSEGFFKGFYLFNSYLKVGFRNLVRYRFYTIINIVGLSMGMTVGLLALAAYVDVEEVDDFQTNLDNIYRVITHYDDGDRKRTYASTSAPVSDLVKEQFTGIEQVVSFNSSFNPEIVLGKGTVPLFGYYADQSFFDVFTFELLAGDPATALSDPYSLVLTEKAAEKLFYNVDPIGKTLEVQDAGIFTVTGIMKEYPRSHLLFEALTSYSTLAALEKANDRTFGLNDWGPVTNFYTYVQLAPGKDVSSLVNGLNASITAQFEGARGSVSFGIQAMSDIAKTDHSNEIGMGWGTAALAVFLVLALLILLPACFNYANISISRSLKRAKEIGLRKVSGGQSSHIFLQFIMETLLMSIVSLLVAVYLFVLIRAEFQSMVVQGSRAFDLEINFQTGVTFVLFGLLTGILAGLLPAIYFSKLNPIETLRNSSASGGLSKVRVKKWLIVTQFALSLIFIMGVAVVIKQYRYALNYDMGFAYEQVLDVELKDADQDVFRTEFGKLAEVENVSMSSSIPGSWESTSTWVKTEVKGDSVEVYQMFIDEHYIDNLELTLLAGENFPQTVFKGEQHILVNEEFLKNFNLATPSEALGQAFLVNGMELTILGVVKDFNHLPLRERISSFFFRYNPERLAFANVKLASGDIQETIEQLEGQWELISPTTKFEASFLEDDLNEGLVSFIVMAKVFGFLGLLAIIISCLGLLAMVVFNTESRIKEMGVRKVMGASVSQLAYILSRSFIKLILIATLIAVPLGYFFFDQVILRIHHFRAAVGAGEILISVAFLFLMSLITIGTRTIKVAHVNPVECLRDE